MPPESTPNSSLSAAASAFEDVLTAEENSEPSVAEPAKQAKSDPPEEGEEDAAQSEEEEEAPAEEASDEPTEEGDDDAGEEPADDDEQEPVYEVRIAGQTAEVPLSELIKGYSRTADYTRKTQQLADERTLFSQEQMQTRALRDQYAHRLQQVQALLQQAEQPQVNWDQLRTEDPIEFAAQWADHQRRQQAMQQVQAEREQISQRHQAEDAQQRAQNLEQARVKLLEIVPEWKDAKVAKAERAALKEFGRSFGYSDRELEGIVDHRAVAVLRMAAKYQDLVQRRASLKPVKRAATAPLKPGAVVPRKEARQVSELTRMKQSHAKVGTVKSAAALFEKLLG